MLLQDRYEAYEAREPVRVFLFVEIGVTDDGGLREEINRHVIRFPDGWSTGYFSEQLGAFEAPRTRFGVFLEGLASAAAFPDERAQRRVVERSDGCHSRSDSRT